MKRDLTAAQFSYACQREGFRSEGMFGYYVALPGTSVRVSAWNAGARRRDQLNYLRRELARVQREQAAEQAANLAMAYHAVRP